MLNSFGPIDKSGVLPPPMLYVITLRNVEKSCCAGAGETLVLRRIDAIVRPGRFVTIMGPSGSRKSTLLSILGMLGSDGRGEYDLDGHTAHALTSMHRIELGKHHVGFVCQQYHLLAGLTVYENLEIPLSYRDVARIVQQSIVADTLDRFQIAGK